MPSSKPPGTEHSSTASQPSVSPDRSRSPEPEPPSFAVASDNKLAVTDATSAKLGSQRCEVRVPAPSQAESFRVFALPTRTGFCFPLPGDTTEVGAEKGISRGQNTSSKTALSSSPGSLSSPWKEMCPRPRRAQVVRLASGDLVGWERYEGRLVRLARPRETRRVDISVRRGPGGQWNPRPTRDTAACCRAKEREGAESGTARRVEYHPHHLRS